MFIGFRKRTGLIHIDVGQDSSLAPPHPLCRALSIRPAIASRLKLPILLLRQTRVSEATLTQLTIESPQTHMRLRCEQLCRHKVFVDHGNTSKTTARNRTVCASATLRGRQSRDSPHSSSCRSVPVKSADPRVVNASSVGDPFMADAAGFRCRGGATCWRAGGCRRLVRGLVGKDQSKGVI